VPSAHRRIRCALAADSARNWEKRLTEADVPCAAIWPISEIVHHKQLEHREVMQEIDAPYGALRLAGSGFRLEHDGGGIDRPPPLLGEHTDEILRQVLGFTDHQVAEIHDSGALDPPRKQAAE